MENSRGAILQRDKQTYAIVPRMPMGLLTPDILENIAAVARKHQIPIIKITSAQRMALVGINPESIDQTWQELGLTVGPAVEVCVNYVQACPGTAVCKIGVQDSLGFGGKLEELFVGVAPVKPDTLLTYLNPVCAPSVISSLTLYGDDIRCSPQTREEVSP